jgi:hypothetical protein
VIQVAIALDIRQPQASELFMEYWLLQQQDQLYKIFQEIKNNLASRTAGSYFSKILIAGQARISLLTLVYIILSSGKVDKNKNYLDLY